MSARYPYRKILIPIDFSDDSRRAFAYGTALAAAAGAGVVLLTAIEDSFPYPELFAWDHPDEDFYKFLRTKALERMDEVIGGSPGVPVERYVVRGNPRQEIGAVAAELDVDLIVLARHGSSGWRKTLMGSTAETVLRGAGCPVLILPPAAAGEGSGTS